MAVGRRRAGNGAADDAAVLLAAAAGCARCAAGAGAATAGGAGTAGVPRMACALVGATGCSWGFQCLWCWRWAGLRGRFLIPRKWADGLRCCSRLRWWCCLLLAAVALRTLRFLLDRVRLQLPSSLRHGLANLYRPGNQSAAVLAALGTGVMLILAVYLMQGSLLRDLRETASPKLPNIFLIDVTTDEVAGVKEFFQHQPGVTQTLDLMPVVTGRFVSLNGQPRGEAEGSAFSAPDAGECRTELGRRCARRRQGDARQVVDERGRCRDGRGRGRGQAAAPGCGLGGGTGDRRHGADTKGGGCLSCRWRAPGRARAVCAAFRPD